MPASKRLTLLSWNVNGIRAASKKGFFDWLAKASPDVLGLQETRASPDILGPEVLNPPGYASHWVSGERKGYSGVAVYSGRLLSIERKTRVSGGTTLEVDVVDSSLVGFRAPHATAC